MGRLCQLVQVSRRKLLIWVIYKINFISWGDTPTLTDPMPPWIPFQGLIGISQKVPYELLVIAKYHVLALLLVIAVDGADIDQFLFKVASSLAHILWT